LRASNLLGVHVNPFDFNQESTTGLDISVNKIGSSSQENLQRTYYSVSLLDRDDRRLLKIFAREFSASL
jgi:hypothetical protein